MPEPITPSDELNPLPFHDSPGGEMTERYERARAALDGALDIPGTPRVIEALRRVLDLHKPVTVYSPTPHCRVCGSLPWPCTTARLVSSALLP